MKPELVSVIMPTYNAGKFLADSIESILSQTYANLELLITDDCSTDGTIDILKDFAQRDKRVKVKYLKSNVGPAIARNRSIERAKGRYIAAAINTMPHGEYTIKDNGFPGQFCLHMVGSKTHETDRVNPEHQKSIERVLKWSKSP